MNDPRQFFSNPLPGERLSEAEALELVSIEAVELMLEAAAVLRDAGHGNNITYSKKVFIPLTRLCRDVCHYCTFAAPPKRGEAAYLSVGEALAIARAGVEAGCREALFTLGDKPELRYGVARDELARLGHDTTISYLAEVAETVQRETGLLAHFNPGVLGAEDMKMLREVSVSQGIMLESAAERLCRKGGPHHGSPDKKPVARLETLRLAGELSVPFTTGILIGIGESRSERIDALLKIRDLHDRYGHIQEVIIQNFRAKAGTRMADAHEPDLEDQLWTIAVARLLFGPAMSIQAPPNLQAEAFGSYISAGINDWGGVSPVTPDHVNPEAPWPHLDVLAFETERLSKTLVERLAVYPDYIFDDGSWLTPEIRTKVLRDVDAEGYARIDDWAPGTGAMPPQSPNPGTALRPPSGDTLGRILSQAMSGRDLGEVDIVRLFAARGIEFDRVCGAADDLRKDVVGEDVTYVINRNINYTNICSYRCTFCAFSKGKLSENLRGRPYDLDIEEIVSRAREARARGATEVCLQGGIHPAYTGETYLGICRALRKAVPDLHIHAFSPLEVNHGAQTLGLGVAEFLGRLREAGLSSLPGTAAEILDDDVRAVICADKISTEQWIDTIAAAHQVGLRTTSTIMYGHMEQPRHWARHLLHLRNLQRRTGVITEFVPLPFVHMEAPMYLKGGARRGPTFREAVLMHAVARLALHPFITNIQTSWPKMGPLGVEQCLRAGVNDLGGTLMDESISRSAGAAHGQEMTPHQLEKLIRKIGRTPRQRTTLYGVAGENR